MKNAILSIILLAIAGTATAQPWLHESEPYAYTQDSTPQPPTLYELTHVYEGPNFYPVRIIYENPKRAAVLYDIAGFSALTVGAYLRGKAEHHRMYHGTSGDFDNFHITRDAGLVVTGLGAAALGTSSACNIMDGRKGTWVRILNRAVFGLFVSRLVSEATYLAMPNSYK